MQPFDNDVFDRRYEDVIKPAIEGAGLEAYRVDQDPTVSIPIKNIEKGIRDSAICLCEITEDNPNVWFELGYAIACRKEVVLIRSEERTSKFPFDVQHRTIITYKTGSRRNLDKLQDDITTKVKAYLEKAEKLTTVSEISKVSKFEGLTQHEVVCIAVIAQNMDHPKGHTTPDQINQDMEQNGRTKLASIVSIRGLLLKSLIEEGQFYSMPDDYRDEDYGYLGYSLTESGWEWIMSNQDKFILQKPKLKPYNSKSGYNPTPDNDIPF
jgi:hypothetical protein